MNLMMLLEMAASGFPDRIALTCGEERLTYGELFAAAGAAAAELRASGATRAAVLDVSSPALPVALFASAWAGVPFVPLNYRLTGAELDRLIEQITPCHLVTDAERAAQLGSRAGVTATSREDYLARVRRGGESAPEWNMDPEEIAILLFTSGTTGPPKAAVLRHKHLVSYILSSVEFGSAAEEAAGLVCVPPYHIAGMAAIASSIYSGRRIVQLASFDADSWIDLVRRERVTNAFVVPTMLARITEALEARGGVDLPSLAALSYGGGKMPLPVIERAMTLFPATTDFTNAYGLTETSSTLTVLGPDDHRSAAASADPEVRRRLGSVGRALPSVEIEIRDEDGKAVGPGVRGEIHVRGEQVSGEYLGKGTRVGGDGFFPTRDGGWLDAEGYLFLEGRIDDIIVRGGENMSPGEIEEVLLEHDAVSDCAVVGVPDEQWGEAVAAAIVTAPGKSVGADELREFVKSRLRSSRAPQFIAFCDELPYNETGKLLRRVVRADLTERKSQVLAAGEARRPMVLSPRPATPILTLAQAIERLQTPDVFEAYSPLTGEPIFAVDLGAETRWPEEIALAVAREALSELPCPSVGLAQGLLSPAAEALVREFDVVVATPNELELVADGVFAHPLASQALAQLLRLSAGCSVHEGLVAESLVYATLQAGPEFAAWLAARPEPKQRAQPDGPAVRIERVEGRVELWLNRPEKRNAFSAEMRDALWEGLSLAVMDPSVSRVSLRGEGPVFCSGGDLDEFGTLPDPATAHAIRSTRHPARLLHALEPRVECVVQGACVGAGIELPAFATRIVARPDASFRLPELSMGLVPGAGGTVSLPRRIGRQRTAWLALTGVAIDVETALSWRVVDAIAE